MLLHRMVDRALAALLEPMGLVHATEGYVTVDRGEIDALAHQHGDPQAVLAGFGSRTTAAALMIAEPALSSTVLSRIWRADRNEGAPLTQVEGEILRQFLAKLVSAWSQAWASEGVRLLPEVMMAGSLAMLRPQLATGAWHVARTVVREHEGADPIGVLLFAYPDDVLPQLGNDARSTLWRSRIDRGLTAEERHRLELRLEGPLRHVSITAPVTIRQDMTLGMLNSLERGDIIAFDEGPHGDITFHMLDREFSGHLAASGNQIALAIGSGEDAREEPSDHDLPPDPTNWDLAS